MSCAAYNFVNPFIGSSGPGFGYGSVAPAAQVPFGALRLGPDTTSSPANIEFRHFSGYNYYDTMIRGFSHTRLAGAGVSDLGTFGIMPVTAMTTEQLVSGPSAWWSLFSKETEFSKPGYYSVHLDLPNVDAELVAASGFAGIHRYNYLSQTGGLTIDLCHTAAMNVDHPSCVNSAFHVLDSTSLTSSFQGSILIDGGLSHGIMVYIYGEIFNKDGTLGTWTTCTNNSGETICEENLHDSTTSQGKLYSYLGLNGVSSLEIRVGISFINEDQAKLNLQDAIHTYDVSQSSIFDSVKDFTTSVWCKEMSVVEFEMDVQSADRSDLVSKLYTGFYRSLMSPTIYSETNGIYLGLDKTVHNVTSDRLTIQQQAAAEDKSGLSMAYYSDLSLWDTFRTMLPWQLLVNEGVSVGILRSMEEMVDTNGAFPRWPLASTESGCMIGMHGAAAVVEGLQKGYESYFNATGIQAAMLAQATVPGAPNGRTNVDFYLKNGYVPTESSDVAASVTLSYAFDDFLLAEISDLLGETSAASEARIRSKNYENIWSKERELMCTRSEAGELHCPIDPIGPQSWNMYKEGDAYHWLYFVPHDMEGLISLYRTKNDFLKSLEAFFQDHVASHDRVGSFLPNPYFWAGNEVCHHTVWFFNSLDCTRSQYWSRKIIPMHFHATPYGLPGNDDYGAMSTYLLFTSLGFFPLAGTTKYFIGSPSVTSANITLKDINGNEKGHLSIVAHDNLDSNVYVQKLLINGVEYLQADIDHDVLMSQITNTGVTTFEFFMSATPSSNLCLK